MSDTSTNPEEAKPEQPQLPQMRILGQYIRDLSFENVVMQTGVASQAKPDIQVQVSMDAKKRTAEHQYEVICKFKIKSTTKEPESTLFLLELEYGGIFHVENVPEPQLHPYLLIECPRMMFPFVRRIVSDITTDGGFPALNLENIDFVNLYRQSIAARQAQAGRRRRGPCPELTFRCGASTGRAARAISRRIFPGILRPSAPGNPSAWRAGGRDPNPTRPTRSGVLQSPPAGAGAADGRAFRRRWYRVPHPG